MKNATHTARMVTMMPPDLFARAKDLSAATGVSTAEVVRDALEFYLNVGWHDAESAAEGDYYTSDRDTYADFPMPFGVHLGPEFWERFDGREWIRWHPREGDRVFGPLPAAEEDQCNSAG